MADPINYNTFRLAVHDALQEAFPEIPVSDTDIPPEHNTPGFFVRLLESTQVHELGRRFRRTQPIAVRYFKPASTSAELLDIAEQLTAALKWVTPAGRLLPGQGMRHETVDGVLSFYVTYSLLVWEQQADIPKMQSSEQGAGLK